MRALRTLSGWLFAVIALTALSPVAALAAPEGPKPLFADNEMIRLTITGPVGTVIRNRARDNTPQQATLVVAGAAPETLPIMLSARGLTRRTGDICQFPPLRVEFAQKPPASSLFRGQKRLKLVTHCVDRASFQQFTLMEYSAYRLGNAVSPVSFRVRLATIDYVDTGGRVIASRVGFFIEDADDVAKRNGMREVDSPPDRVPIAQLNARAAGRTALFEYMVGNLDWAMTAGPPGAGCCHNTKLIGPESARSGLTPIPYDYDYSGLVDAPYALPPDSVNVSSVRVRRYRGFCSHNAETQAAAAEMRARRQALMAVYDDVPQLEDGRKRKARAYLTQFFDQIADEKAVGDNLLKTCIN